MLWHKRRKLEPLEGCWRRDENGVLDDLRICAFIGCPFRGNGCQHRVAGYEYGVVLVATLKNRKLPKPKTERMFYG